MTTATSRPTQGVTNTSAPAMPFDRRTDQTLRELHEGGQYKHLTMIDSPMGPEIRVRRPDGSFQDVLCFCSNNYLGLANDPDVVEAGVDGLRRFGAGTASVRFICGTFTPHEELEATIASYMGTEAAYTFVSCWTANEAIFATFAEAGDLIISDELNHASIIDGIRLATQIKKGTHRAVYKHNDLEDLREKLKKAREVDGVRGQVWIVTDGVFSMEGDIADLPALRKIADEFEAMLVVDDSHGHGVMGAAGRGTHEHFGMHPGVEGFDPSRGQVDFFTGTLGKALGGGAGGFIAGSRRGCELIVQRGRPTLFSNALPVTVACSANAAIRKLMETPALVERLRENVRYARKQIGAAGFEVLDSPTAICPIIVGDTAKAIAMSKKLMELGVFVIGFGYPVVPEGAARLRIQMSAAHTREHIDRLVDALKQL